MKTTDFDRLSDLEAEMDEAEKLRLLYVACTRARDHLLVATHHVEGALCFAKMIWDAAASAPDSCVRRDCPVPGPRVVPDRGAPAPFDPSARAAWLADRRTLLAAAAKPRVLSATAIRRALGGDGAEGASTEPLGRAGRGPDGDVTLEPVDPVDSDGLVLGPDPWCRGRAATAFGRAVHAVLQDVDLGDPSAMEDLARAAARAEGIGEAAAGVAAAARTIWDAPVVRAAAVADVRREAYVAAPVGGVTVEGYVDLLLRDADGVTIVDYKTDALGPVGGVAARAGEYRPQLAAYAVALERATGLTVAGGVLVFAAPAGALEVRFTREELDTGQVVARLDP